MWIINVCFYLQALRSFKLTITVDPKYHPKIIGRKGAIITQIRNEHEVNIQFQEKNDENQVTGWSLKTTYVSLKKKLGKWPRTFFFIFFFIDLVF